MASTDFDFDGSKSTTNVVFAGDSSGGALIHSSLSSPLTGDGVYGREWAESDVVTASASYARQVLIKSTFASSLFDAVPIGNAISLRAWVRVTAVTPTSLSSNYGIGSGVVAKSVKPGDVTTLNETRGGLDFAGYKLRLTNIAATTSTVTMATAVTLRLAATNSTGNTDAAAPEVVCSGSYAVDTWYNIRLDVTSQGSGSDLLQAYTGAGSTGSEVWTLVGSQTISSGLPTYAPWSNSARRYGCFGHGRATAGISAPYAWTSYVDRFRAFRDAL